MTTRRKLDRVSKSVAKEWAIGDDGFNLRSFDVTPAINTLQASVSFSVQEAATRLTDDLEKSFSKAKAEFFEIVTQELVKGLNGEQCGMTIMPDEVGELAVVVGGSDSSVFPHELRVSRSLNDITKEIVDYQSHDSILAWRDAFRRAEKALDAALAKQSR